MKKSNILIIGGGPAGVEMAKALSKSLNPAMFTLQLVNGRDFYVHLLAMLRMITTTVGLLEYSAFIPYDRIFEPGKPGEFINGTVDRVVGGDTAILMDGRRLHFDYLVLASGTKWSGPLAVPTNKEDALEWVNNWRSKIAAASSILIVGGGAVGFELAGEIKHAHPEKTVTIIHANVKLFNDVYTDKFRDRAVDAISRKGVNVILGDMILDLPDKMAQNVSLTTARGNKVEADLLIPTPGGKLNTSFLRSLDRDILTPKGEVRVLPTLQVEGHENIFAVGDIIAWKEEKQLTKIPEHVAVAAANLLSVVKGSTPVKQYSTAYEILCLPIGPTGGITFLSSFGGMLFGDWVSVKVKAKNLFLPTTRKGMNYN